MSAAAPMTLNFVERGAGTPVLALHGWTPDHRLMLGCLEPVFAPLDGYRRLYPDLPGMGRSPASPSMAGSDDVLQAVEDFVQSAIGTEPFLLVGESYGGYLARALARSRAEQVLGLALICPIGVAVERAERTVPARQVLRADADLLTSLDRRLAAEFEGVAVVQSPETVRRFREEILPGLDVADTVAMARIQKRWRLSVDPEGGEPFQRPTLILTGRQDDSVGYLDQFALLPHYPRASFAVLDVAGHNLQIEQAGLFDALMLDWLDRVAAEA
ncbi:alpha/beta hydrolase [Streptomyces sp. NPDC053755]|uniref:alpha/beta fold hydrolase n=1 Tax=Streptomyces sp. NPDC053755 TaxID=3155815 RepID=UPI00342AE421